MMRQMAMFRREKVLIQIQVQMYLNLCRIFSKPQIFSILPSSLMFSTNRISVSVCIENILVNLN